MSSDILTREQLAALGAIVAESAELESNVDLWLTFILNMTGQQYEIIVKSQTLHTKLTYMKALGLTKLRSLKNKSALTEIMDRLMAISPNSRPCAQDLA